MVHTVMELLEHYISRKPLTSLTIRNYRSIVLCFSRLATPEIDRIDEEVCLIWRKYVLQVRSAATYNSYLRLMRALFSYGVERGLVDSNPFKLLYFSPQYTTRPKGVTDDVLKAAIEYLDSHDNPAPGWFWSLVVRFMAQTGVRARQIVALEWRDLDWDNLIIQLRASASKTRREWEIPLPSSLVEPLQHLHTRSAAQHKTGPNDQVFNVTLFNQGLHTHFAGNSMKVEQLNGFFRRLSDKIGARISSRRLRHYLATKMANCGNPDLFAIQDLLGHTDIRTTRMYVKTDVERIRQLMMQVGIN